MYVHYMTNENGRLLRNCPNGKECLVGGGECMECEHFKGKEIRRKFVKCKFRRKGINNG